MSAPAQVTEAHRVLARHLSTEAESVPHLCDLMAQAIADSEARAVEQANVHVESLLSAAKNAIPASEHPAEPTVQNWAWQIRNLGEDRRLVYAELARLRAEVERLKADGAANAFVNMSCRASRAETDRNNLRADLDAIKSILTEEKARAERAEAELDGIRALADRRNERDHSQDTTHQLVAALDQALDIAQAELATERKKVRTLREACERLRDCDWVITLPNRMDAVRDIARAALAATEEKQ